MWEVTPDLRGEELSVTEAREVVQDLTGEELRVREVREVTQDRSEWREIVLSSGC